MTTAGQIDVKLGLNSEEFIKGCSNAESRTKQLEKNLKGLGDSIGGNTNPAVNMLSGAVKKLAGAFTVAMIGKKLVDLGREAVNTAAKFESLAVSFEVLTGGAEAGQKLTNEIMELAAKTPLTTEALTYGARTLLSFGETANDVVGDLKLLGDIAGGDAQKMQSLTLAFAQVGSAGKLAGQDLLQMINAGFNPLETMAKRTGKSMGQLKKEMSEGKITFNDVKQAMIDATSEGGRFYGMMDKQSETLEGRLSTLNDTWEKVSKTIGEIFLPMAKKAVDAMISLGESTNKTIKWLQSEDSTLKGLKQSWDKYWASKRKSKAAITFEMTPKKGAEKEIEKQISEAATGFTAMSGAGTPTGDSPAVKAAKKQKQDLLNISKQYAQEMANIESLNTAKSDLMADGGRFQRNYSEKLQILQWYYNEKYRITQAANGDLSKAQEQFAQLEELKEKKLREANISGWTDWGQTVKGIVGNSLNSLLTATDDFGDAMMNVMNMIYQSLIKMAIDSAMKEIEVTQIKTTIISALNAMTGGIGGALSGIGGKISGFFGKFHSGGLSTSEQLAVIRKDERVLSPAETTAYNNGGSATSTNGVNNIMMFNIKAWDGKDVINTLKSNSQTINQIVASGIKNNNQGLRTTVQNT
jgi:tape measure domain-containing protein